MANRYGARPQARNPSAKAPHYVPQPPKPDPQGVKPLPYYPNQPRPKKPPMRPF